MFYAADPSLPLGEDLDSSRKYFDEATKAVYDAVIQRRQQRSLLPADAGGNLPTTKLWLSTEDDGDLESLNPKYCALKVMQQNGELRNARNLYEWVQQFCVEQCALLLGMEAKGVEHIKAHHVARSHGQMGPDMRACALFAADCYELPDFVPVVERWWTSIPLFSGLIKARRAEETVARAARVVLQKVHPQGHVISGLVEPYLKPPMATSFPCAPEDLKKWLAMEIGGSEYFAMEIGGGNFRVVDGVEVFCEWGEMPHSAQEFGAYAIATSPCLLHVETEIEEVAADFFEEEKELVVRLVSEEDVMRGF